MIKSAAVSVRLSEELKAKLESGARQSGRSIASYVEFLLEGTMTLPKWNLRDCSFQNFKKQGPRVTLTIADGMPAAMMTASHAEDLGHKLIAAAKAAREIPASD